MLTLTPLKGMTPLILSFLQDPKPKRLYQNLERHPSQFYVTS
jgi:phage terminase large subunit-like protein